MSSLLVSKAELARRLQSGFRQMQQPYITTRAKLSRQNVSCKQDLPTSSSY